jgi:lysyl-tRNA synthetase class 2
MIEWYRTGNTHLDQMRVVEELVVAVCREVHAWSWTSKPAGNADKARLAAASSPDPIDQPGLPRQPFIATTYREAFLRHTGADVVLMPTEQIASWSTSRGLHPPPGLAIADRDGWLNWLLAELVEPQLGRERPEFLYDYPASQAALACVRSEEPPVAERFELYWRGIELCNGYHELRDAEELRRRIEGESSRRIADGLPALPTPGRLLAAMQSGLPDCSGVALGFDRLMAVATAATSIRDVLPFAFDDC